MARSRALASDGFIVYDIQDEPGRSDLERPFPFRRVMDSSRYAALLARSSGKQCLVYKCVADANFEEWLERASTEHGHCAVNIVGRASSQGEYHGPTISEAMDMVAQHESIHFGCVCIAERHTLEAAHARGKSYPTEHLNMIRKQKAGCEWFISQAVYDPEPTIRLLKDYAATCREHGMAPRKVVLTFAPVSRAKTIQFIQWLGVRVPPDAEKMILEADKPVDASVELCCDILTTILSECAGVGVPLGISCESISIYKAEIDGVHELFKRLQGILLDARGSPWKVQWVEVMPLLLGDKDEEAKDTTCTQSVSTSRGDYYYPVVGASLAGVVVGGMLVAAGVVLGDRRNK